VSHGGQSVDQIEDCLEWLQAMADPDPASKSQKGSNHTPTAGTTRCKRRGSIFTAGPRAYHRSHFSRVENWRSPLHFSRSYCTSWCSSGLVRQHHADHAAHRSVVVFCFRLSSSFFFISSQLCYCAALLSFCILHSSMPHMPLRGEAFTHFCTTSSPTTQPCLHYLTTSFAAFVASGDHNIINY